MPSRYYHQFRRVHVLASSSAHPLRKAILISIVFSALAFFAVLFFIFWYLKLLKQRRSNKTSPDGSSFKIRRFKYRELKKATKCFAHSEKLGKGGFGVVYRGLLGDGRVVAVKKLDLSSLQGEREFENELSICSKLNSPYVVSLLGYCTHGKKERLLVYECMQNRSLQEALFDKGYHTHLDWDKRFKIILDAAKALEFLHFHCKPPIIHGDIKPSNVLLDSHFSARIADFGLAKFKTEGPGLEMDRVSSYAEQMKVDMSDKFRVGNSDNSAPGTPEMNRSPTIGVSGSNHFYRATMESPSVTHKLLPKESINFSASDPGDAVEVVMDAAAAFCTAPSLVQSAQAQLYTHEVDAGFGGSDFGQKSPAGDTIDVLKNTFTYGDSNICEMSGFMRVQFCSKDFSPLPVNHQLSTKVHACDSSWSQEAKGDFSVVDWSGSEEELVPASEKAVGGKEQKDKSGLGEPSTGITRKERMNVRPTQRKSREWWKDEYFAELKGKNKVINQKFRSKRKYFSSVGNWKDFLSGELYSFSDKLRKIDGKVVMDVGRGQQSNDFLCKARSGDLTLCRGRSRWTRTPSMAVDIMWSRDLNGQLSNERFHRQGSGNLIKSGELASRDASSSTSMRGTVCYVAPEYGGNGVLSEKSDIYSFGVLMLVIMSGRRPIQVTASPMEEFEKANLISWARCLSQSGRLLDLMDEGLQDKYNCKQATMCIMVALLCLQRVPTSRPDISEIVKTLSGETMLPLSLSSSPPSRTHYRLPVHASKEFYSITVSP